MHSSQLSKRGIKVCAHCRVQEYKMFVPVLQCSTRTTKDNSFIYSLL